MNSQKLIAAFLTIVAFTVGDAFAQYSTISTPFNNTSDQWYERHGVNFGFQLGGTRNVNPNADRARGVFGLSPTGGLLPNIRFSQGSAQSAVPPFGGYDPGADASIGFAVRNGNGSGFNLGFVGGKGSNRTFTNTTPSVTVPNGVRGQIFDGRLTPFVTGFTPIVGGGAPVESISPIELAIRNMQMQMGLEPSKETWNELIDRYQSEEIPQTESVAQPTESTANTADKSVAAIKRQRAVEKQREKDAALAKIDSLVEEAKEAFRNGKKAYAKSLVGKAMRRSSGEKRKQLEETYKKLGGKVIGQ